MSRSHKQRDRNRVQHQRHKAMQLRDIAQQAIHRFIERLQERFAWWQETFHTPAIGAQWLFDEACFWIEELLHRIGLSGSKLRRHSTHELGRVSTTHCREIFNRKRPSSRRDHMLIESLEPRVVLTGPAEMLIELGFDSNAISTIRNFGNDSFFVASTYDHGRELWKLDSGSPTGIRLVADINPGRASSNPTNLTDLGGTLYFTASNLTDGTELWRINGSGLVEIVDDTMPGTGIGASWAISNRAYLDSARLSTKFVANTLEYSL